MISRRGETVSGTHLTREDTGWHTYHDYYSIQLLDGFPVCEPSVVDYSVFGDAKS